MKTPIDLMLDKVEWSRLPVDGETRRGSIPYATHRGVLSLGNYHMEVFQLSDGQRVIEQQSVERFINDLYGRSESGR